MKPPIRIIEPPDTFFLSAAMGWVELGDPVEAEVELLRLSSSLAQHPDVLEVRWIVSASREAWDQGLAIAETLCQMAPDRPSAWLHRAYALRRASGGGLKKALEILLPAADRFPDCSTISYNLACYACQLDRFEEAHRWLEKARQIGGKKNIQQMALRDVDLESLWPEIERW